MQHTLFYCNTLLYPHQYSTLFVSLPEYEPRRHNSNNLSGDTNYFQISRDRPGRTGTDVFSPLTITLSPASDWLAPLSSSVSLLISPFSISLCRLKSTRLTAVSGGLIVALSCLFSSFATQFHQLIISLGLIQGKATHASHVL